MILECNGSWSKMRRRISSGKSRNLGLCLIEYIRLLRVNSLASRWYRDIADMWLSDESGFGERTVGRLIVFSRVGMRRSFTDIAWLISLGFDRFKVLLVICRRVGVLTNFDF